MKIAIVGGTGFVGHRIVDAVVARGHQPVLLVRPGSRSKLERPGEVTVVPGNLQDEDALARLVEGCEAAIYLPGILREVPREGITFETVQLEGARRVIDKAERAGVRRLLLMSANGVRENGTPYQRTKYLAEQAARESRLGETIFRPSVIFGDPQGRMEFATQLFRDMVRPPLAAVDFFSLLGDNRGPVRMSPVHVEDVADAFAVALEDDDTVGGCYSLAGPDVLTWGEVIRRVADAVGRDKWLLPMPVELMFLAAALLDWLPVFPVTRDQLRMLAEGNTAAPDELMQLIGRKPRPFSVEQLKYLQGG